MSPVREVRDNPRCSCAVLFGAHFDAGADFDFFVDERGDFGGEADAAVGGGVAGEDADVHADGAVEAAEPAHGCAFVVGAAGGAVHFHGDAGADDASAFIEEVAVGGGAVVFVFFGDGETAGGRHACGFAAGDGGVYVNLLAGHEVGALFGEGDDDAGVVGVDDGGEFFVDDGRGLFADEFACAFHRRGLWSAAACPLRKCGRTAREERGGGDGDENNGRELHRVGVF